MTARVEDLEKLGRILDDAVSDGANGLGGISFGLKDPAPAMAEARRLSVLDAIEQAELYAEAAGVKLLRITGITPQAGFRPVPMMAARSMAAEMVDAVPVSGGEIETRAEVTITLGDRRGRLKTKPVHQASPWPARAHRPIIMEARPWSEPLHLLRRHQDAISLAM